MNAYQTAVHKSNVLIVAEAEANAAAVALIPIFGRKIIRLKELNLAVESCNAQQEKDLKGVTIGKEEITDSLIHSAVNIAGALHSYAEEEDDTSLQIKINYTEAILEDMGSEELIAATSIILEAAESIENGALADFGISTEEIAALRTLLNNYKEIHLSPRKEYIDRSVYTHDISKYLAESMSIRANYLNPLARQFRTKAPDFHAKYIAARNIIFKRQRKAEDNNSTNTATN
jgi:hypothetical protein